MESKDFKDLFDLVARANEFDKAFGGWFKESAETIIVLDLQKSNFGNYFELNFKVYVNGFFGHKYSKSKDLVKKDVGDIFMRQPHNYRDVFNLDDLMIESIRKEKLERLFIEFIVPISRKSKSRDGLKELSEEGKIFLLPTVKDELFLK